VGLNRFAPSREDRTSFRFELGIGDDAPLVGLVAGPTPSKITTIPSVPQLSFPNRGQMYISFWLAAALTSEIGRSWRQSAKTGFLVEFTCLGSDGMFPD